MDYTLIASTDVGALEKAVKLMIPEGWRPNGPPVPLPSGQMCQSLVKGGGNGGASEVSSEDITDATELGRSVLTAADGAAVRSAIGAGTSDLELGTGPGQAMPGNTPIPAPVTWETLDKPAVIAAGADQAAARNAIGAGTGNSNLALGTGPTQAAAGDHNHDGQYATTQALADLVSRVEALESAAG